MRAKIPPRNLYRYKPISLINTLGLLILLVTAVFLLSAFSLKQKSHTSIPSSSQTPTFEDLYGFAPEQHGPASCSGPCQLLLLSDYNSKASLFARLLMLMGVFAGDPEQLSVDATNKLHGWELRQAASLHDLMLDKYAAPGSPARLGRGFHPRAMSASDLDYYQDRVHGIVRYLDHHKPWLIKDPRLVWFAPLWLERLEHPLCVILVDLQPWQLALQLSDKHQQQQQQQLVQEAVSPYVHLERWTNSTLSALQACLAVPTMIVPNTVLQPPLLQPFLAALLQHLQAAGVPNIRLPSASSLQQQYISDLHENLVNSNAGNSCQHAATQVADLGGVQAAGHNVTADGAALLQQSCHWLPPPAAAAAADGGGGSTGGAGSSLPVPTRALLGSLVDHLRQHLAQPKAGLDYTKVAGRVLGAYSSRLKQLMHEQPGLGSHTEHHGVAELIQSALKYVSTEHKLL